MEAEKEVEELTSVGSVSRSCVTPGCSLSNKKVTLVSCRNADTEVARKEDEEMSRAEVRELDLAELIPPFPLLHPFSNELRVLLLLSGTLDHIGPLVL